MKHGRHLHTTFQGKGSHISPAKVSRGMAQRGGHSVHLAGEERLGRGRMRYLVKVPVGFRSFCLSFNAVHRDLQHKRPWTPCHSSLASWERKGLALHGS